MPYWLAKSLLIRPTVRKEMVLWGGLILGGDCVPNNTARYLTEIQLQKPERHPGPPTSHLVESSRTRQYLPGPPHSVIQLIGTPHLSGHHYTIPDSPPRRCIFGGFCINGLAYDERHRVAVLFPLPCYRSDKGREEQL
jgi:hypothetical protein